MKLGWGWGMTHRQVAKKLSDCLALWSQRLLKAPHGAGAAALAPEAARRSGLGSGHTALWGEDAGACDRILRVHLCRPAGEQMRRSVLRSAASGVSASPKQKGVCDTTH